MVYFYHEYEDIETTTSLHMCRYVSNGFIVDKTYFRDVTLMYPPSGYYYEVPSFTHGLKTTGTENFLTLFLTTER